MNAKNAKRAHANRVGGSKLNNGQMALNKSQNIIFIISALMFNILVSVVYFATKFDLMALLQISGFIIISLIVPFTITLREYLIEKAEKKVIISNSVILLYLLVELLLDYVLKIPFREILALHVSYIIVFYAAEFSIMSVSFNIDRKARFMVAVTFCILIGCLAYLYLG